MVFCYAYNLESAVKKLDTKGKVISLKIKLNATYTNESFDVSQLGGEIARFFYKPAKKQLMRQVYTLKWLRKLLKSVNKFLSTEHFCLSSDLEEQLVEIIKIIAKSIYEMNGKKALISAYKSLGTPHFYIEMHVCGPYGLMQESEG